MKNVAEKAIHIRRCHLCGSINEIEAAVVIKCHSCGKHFAPFLFFDEKAAMGIEVDHPEVRSLGADWQHLLKNQYPPLWGLAVYW
ncbi:MAG: hypothetical protein H7061_11955 [Bdellovibrionaceae bacterium]|nr:hypothetical protein [Bdellovibrio sp.]